MPSKALTKKDFLAEYVRLKNKLNKKTESVTRREFRKNSGLSDHNVLKVFDNFSDFSSQGEILYIEKMPKSERAVLSERLKKYDDNATKEDCIKSLRDLQKVNENKFVTRVFYRIHGKYSDSVWNKYFGTFSEFKRQAGLELTRHQHAAERGIAKHAAFEHYNDYFKANILPYYNKYPKNLKKDGIATILIMSDLHDEECDEFSLEIFIDTCKRKQPDIIVLNGDLFDLYEFSGFSKDPRNIKVKERFDFMHNRVFKALREACPNAQIDFIMGNHEYRLIRLLADASPHLRVLLSDVVGLTFAKVFGLDQFKINWVSKLDFRAYSKKDIKDEMKRNFKIYFDCYAVTHEPDSNLMKVYSGTNGHHHKAMYTSTTNAKMGATSWVQTPSLHVKDAEYLGGFPVWDLGFLEVIINIEKKQVVQKIHQTHDDWSVIDGVLYERKK